MDKIVFEVSQEDRLFVEKECEKTLRTFNSFFQLLLNEYREHRTAYCSKEHAEAPMQPESATREPKKQISRKNEKNTSEA